MSESPDVEILLRELAPQVLGVLTRRYGDFGAAEDAVQESLLAASVAWPRDGIPAGARGWLIQTAERRLIDQWRSDSSRKDRETIAALQEVPGREVSDQDDTLTVLFMCCHPALTPASAIALTLRAVGGLTTAEIAKAFMVDEATMAQRISRAKQRIKASAVPFRMPSGAEQEASMRSVLHVLYLIFNEGYTSSTGRALLRAELSDEAIRLTRMVRRVLPDDGEVIGLLALMLLSMRGGPRAPMQTASWCRWRSRTGRCGTGHSSPRGLALVDLAVGGGAVGEYQLQAAIAAVHDRAATAADTDWPQILALYGLLDRMTGNPIVTLNRAVAAAMAESPAAGLAVLETVDESLAGHYRLDAVRAHLLELAGDTVAAQAHYRAAAERTTSVPERRFLALQAARLNAAATDDR